MINDNHSNIPITKLCENGLLDWILIPTPSLTKINVDIGCSIIAVNIREVNRKYLVTAKWRKSTLHENIWQWKKSIAKECQVVTIVQLHIWKNDQQGVSKVSTSCQQGVRFVIISRWKICKSSFLSSFVFVFAFVIFWREGRGPKKYFEKWGRGGTKIWSLNNWAITPPP